MDIPSWDEFNDLDTKVNEIGEKLDLLISKLDIPKKYMIRDNHRFGSFTSEEEAYQYINNLNKEFMEQYPGQTGCISVHKVDVFPV